MKGPVDAARVMEVLSTVPDPEIPAVSIVDLGIVRGVDAGRAAVLLTPTYTGCPATLAIEMAVRRTLADHGLGHLDVETVLSPPWTTDWISADGREKLRAYGIAPPPPGAASASLRGGALPTQCPRCGSTRTDEISRFGSTPCKALWRCQDCLEPFDRFKCH
ncbi:1,2-phenylacetyl-CoA epoxidase subunit PaaD [Niveispirillum sp. KHB5.9]|uniref:1,2-phenylacetyl-CoA epoxidase subunit PaaD n=1 Tax=Niveispirillum sp. KHB5.9 TaxID=3400269 RepID=UPI003A84F20A